MINSSEFAKRLKKVMDYHQLSPSAFADKIKVQRSSISHLLSGRNKPSLDFVMKVIKTFDEIDLYWLLNGKGVFPALHSTPLKTSEQNSEQKKFSPSKSISTSSNEKTIEKIVMFYTDGTFKEFSNQKKIVQ